jgi:hypothetical protein
MPGRTPKCSRPGSVFRRCTRREYVEDGGPISYGPNIVEIARRSAFLWIKCLEALNRPILPVEQPTKFELVINPKIPKARSTPPCQPLLARYTSGRGHGKCPDPPAALLLASVVGIRIPLLRPSPHDTYCSIPG